MTHIELRQGTPRQEGMGFAVCLWLLVAGLAVLVANAVAVEWM